MKLTLLLLLFCALCVPARAQRNVERVREQLAEIQRIRAALVQKEKALREELKILEGALDTTESVSNICPVHSVKMQTKRVPIGYGMRAQSPTAPPFDVRKREFPFALNYWRGGCETSDLSPADAVIYICPGCQRAEKKWSNEHRSKTDKPLTRKNR